MMAVERPFFMFVCVCVRGGALTYFCVLSSCCVSGDSQAGCLAENPFLGYSAVNKGRD